MDPNPNNFPILSYVMSKLPSLSPRRSAAATADEFDIEQQPPLSPSPKAKEEPYFELSEQMPHLDDPKIVAAMRLAVAEVAQARAALRNLGQRLDHEAVDNAKARLAEIESELSSDLEEISLSPRSADSEGRKDDQGQKAALEEREMYKAVISLEEMHAEYEKMLEEAERKLEKIYEAAVAGGNMAAIEECISGKRAADGVEEEEEVKEEVVTIMKEASEKVIERVDLSEKKLRMLPEAFFATLRSLVALNLSNNQLEVIPDSIAGLEKIEELNLSSNFLESLPDSIGLLSNLKILDVSRNKLTALPDSICRCRSLEELDVSFNKLTYLPTNIGYELLNLRRLFINLNKIRSLPTSIGEMKSLRLLDAHFNELRGLPVSIGKLNNLEILNLSSNFSDLSELPYTIGDLTNLKELDVSNNQIHELPDSFGRLDNLTKLNVDQNPLVIPPKQIVDEGVQTVKAYMVKRRLDMLLEQDRMSKLEEQSEPESMLTRSTSWLNNFVANVSGYLVGEGSSKTDPYLNQQF